MNDKIEKLIEKQRIFNGYNERKDYNKPADFINNKKREIGEEWIDEEGYKCVQKNGYIKKSKKGKDYSLMNLYRCKCGRIIINENEHNILVETGKCYKCHSKEETYNITQNKEFVPPSWYTEIFIKDSYGIPRIHIDDVIKKSSLDGAIQILTNLKNDIIKMKETHKINEFKLKEIENKLNKLKIEKNGQNDTETHSKNSEDT